MIKLILSKIFLLTIFTVSCFAQEFTNNFNKQAWVDFPKEPLNFHLNKQNTLFQNIDLLIDEYHKMDKTNLSFLEKRIILLEQIGDELKVISNQTNDSSKIKILYNLISIANKKAWYLTQLKKIHESSFDKETVLSDYFNRNTIQPKNYLSLELINKISYDANLPSYWGLYLLEVVDPCHRLHLTPYYLKWEKTDKTIPFFIWMEEQDVPYYSPQVIVFNQNDLDNFTYNISKTDHLLYDSKNQLANLENENTEFLYIITLDKKILIVERSDKIRHTSLSKGNPVLGVGTIKVQAGKIIYCDVESGHYQPTSQHIKQVIEIFNDLGAELSENLKIKYYEDQKAVKTTLKDFQSTYINTPNIIKDKH